MPILNARLCLWLFTSTLMLFTLCDMIESTRIATPAYFEPCSGLNGCPWVQLLNVSSQVQFVVINPNNGPGNNLDPNYVNQIATARAAGIDIIGYVYTNYARRDIETVKTQVSFYLSQYRVDGIFFDEVSATCSNSTFIEYYRELNTYAKSLNSKYTILNPGTGTGECYMEVSDIIVNFESPFDAYKRYRVESWVRTYPASRFWHIVYGVQGSQLKKCFHQGGKKKCRICVDHKRSW